MKALTKTSDIVSPYLTRIYNKSIQSKSFPHSLKQAEVIPIYKKDDKSLMKNYRPISILPVISKIFERNMYNQILNYIEKFLSPYLFGFRKGLNSEQCLLVMIEGWRKALDQRKNLDLDLDLSIRWSGCYRPIKSIRLLKSQSIANDILNK